MKDIFLDTVYISAMKRRITPKSLNQKRYIEAIRKHDIVFGIGPAGTGKTWVRLQLSKHLHHPLSVHAAPPGLLTDSRRC